MNKIILNKRSIIIIDGSGNVVSNEEIKQMLEAKRRGVDIKKEKIKSENYKICPNCKTKNPEKALFCVKCGNKLDKKLKVKCPSCSTENPSDAKFCVGCGETLKKANLEKKPAKFATKKSESNDVEFSKPELESTESSAESVQKPAKTKSYEPEKTAPKTGIPSEVPEHGIISNTGLKKTCPSCQGQNLKSAKFCVVCGEKFDGKSSNNVIEETGKTSVMGSLSAKEDKPLTNKSYAFDKSPSPEIKVPDSIVELKNKGKREEKLEDEKNVERTVVPGESDIQEPKITPDMVDPVEKIKKTKELLDIGAITSEEFDHIKKKYLEQI